MVEKIKSWSYSRYACYKECPAKAKYKFIDKLKEPPAPAMERGDKIHKMAEAYLKGWNPVLPPELKLFAPQFKMLKESKPIVEDTWAFRSDWSQTKWDDWSGCWLRVKLDAACVDETTLYVIDHKTGKMRDGYDEQLSLYALSGMLVNPAIKTVSTQMWFLDAGEPVVKEYSADDRKDLQSGWEKKVKPMLADTTFKPKSGNHCRFCHFSKSKGGPCQY